MTLSEEQFDPIKFWDRRMEGHHSRLPAAATMPTHEMRTHIDPVFKPWEKFHRQEAGYLGGLAEHIKKRGIMAPIILDEHDRIYDGHHRLAAAEIAGIHEVPWRRISREP